ncbi:MAG: hormogonium tapered terminus morphoprotein TftA [Microcystaceae cyanobacterium]
MGRIFLAIGQKGEEINRFAGKTVADTTIAAQQMILLRDHVVAELRSRGCEALSVPDDLNLSHSIQWINHRACQGDIALAIEADVCRDSTLRGSSIFHIANNIERKKHAELMLLLLARRLPQISSRGTQPDTATAIGSVRFCRQVLIPSLLMKVGYLTNPDDRDTIVNQRRKMAIALGDGLMAWSREVAGTEANQTSSESPKDATYSNINITLNNQIYDESGILINGNACIPIDLSDRLEIELTQSANIHRVQYQGIVYVKAIELRDYNISVAWDHLSRTVVLRSILPIYRNQIERIVGYGHLSEIQMIMFLKANNEKALINLTDLPKFYREEGTNEGINYDIAFCQMCLETNFLRFGSESESSQNNFANLGSGEGGKLATFPDSRIGVRAHIQHLKAYSSREPLGQEVVDPRFNFVTRGIAPLVSQLSGRWSADLSYGTKIMALLRRLYESAGLL